MTFEPVPAQEPKRVATAARKATRRAMLSVPPLVAMATAMAVAVPSYAGTSDVECLADIWTSQ